MDNKEVAMAEDFGDFKIPPGIGKWVVVGAIVLVGLFVVGGVFGTPWSV